jgi:CMP-N-acetylneuraminic acid synthetase
MDDLSGYDIDREIDLKFIEFLLKEEIWKSEV